LDTWRYLQDVASFSSPTFAARLLTSVSEDGGTTMYARPVLCARSSGTVASVLMFLIACVTTVAAQSSVPTPLLFSGNSTVVAPPVNNTGYGFGPNQFAALARRSDCSMFAILAELNTQSVQLIQADYQDTLHQLAGLTTRGDQWTGGCPTLPSGDPAYAAHTYAGTSGTEWSA